MTACNLAVGSFFLWSAACWPICVNQKISEAKRTQVWVQTLLKEGSQSRDALEHLADEILFKSSATSGEPERSNLDVVVESK
jgi:hypothetical protein